MSETRTVTGSYILRPTSKIGYIHSSNEYFSDYFTGDAPSSWRNELRVTDTALGDRSDSTYAQVTPDTGASQLGYNMRFWTTPDTDTPEWDYKITSVTSSIRWAGSHDYGGGVGRAGRIFSTLYDPSTASQSAVASSFKSQFWQDGHWDNSITTIGSTSTYSESSRPSYVKRTYPKAIAFCLSARKLTVLQALNWLRCYEIAYTVNYSYIETAETVHFVRDSGVTVAVGTDDVPSGDYTTWRHTTWTLTATPLPGYMFDGWYLNGVKVSDNLSYTYELYEGDHLYCLTKVRKLYVGSEPVQVLYQGSDVCEELYLGSVKVYGDSDLLPDALSHSR